MERTLRAALAGLSAAAILAFMGLVGLRLGHPFGFDASESVWIESAARLADGDALYAAPSLDHVPLPGLPLFPAAAATLMSFLGVHFWVGRLVSVIATLITAWLIFRCVRLETDSLGLGFAGAGLFLGGFAATGAMFDMARPEALAWLLAFGGLAILRWTRGIVGAAVASLAMALACFTAHGAAALAVAALIHLTISERDRLLPYLAGLSASLAGGWILLSGTSPWFTFYAWDLPLHGLELDGPRLWRSLGAGVLGTLGPLSVAVLLGFALPAPFWRGRAGVWSWALVGGVVAVAFGAAGPTAVSPGIGPALVALAIAGPCALARVVNHLAAWPGSERAGRSWVLHAVLLLQFASLAHGSRGLMPDPAARPAHAVLIERLRELPEPVRIPGFALAARESGHRPALHPVALETLLDADGNRVLAADPAFARRLLGALEKGPNRPTVVSDRPFGKMGDANQPWARLARGYDGPMEWRELAGTPAPRFVQTPRLLAVSVTDPQADATGIPTSGVLRDTSTTR